MSSLHTPREVHSVSAVPFRRKPFSHVDTHFEPKLKEPFGSEQDREPWGGEFIGWHLLAWRQTETEIDYLQIKKMTSLPAALSWMSNENRMSSIYSDCISAFIRIYNVLHQLLIYGHTLTDRKCMTPVALWQTFCHVCANQIKSLFTLDCAYWAIAVYTQGVLALHGGMGWNI